MVRASEGLEGVPKSNIATAMVHRIGYLSDKRGLGGKSRRLDGIVDRAIDAFCTLLPSL